jgi:REP element-mobilizing transposase RayT
MPQSYAVLWYHLIFATKNRACLLDHGLKERVHSYLAGITGRLGGNAQAIGGVADHVHALIQLPQECSIAEAARVLKANSSKKIHGESPSSGFAWQNGYAAFSVSVSQLDRVCAYIADQERHHQTVDFTDELAAFLVKHGLEPRARALG